MNGIRVLALFVVVLAAQAKMPPDLTRFLAFSDEAGKARTEALKEEINTNNLDVIETARKNLGAGEVEQYMPAPIKVVECHVEFQETKKLPGRCIKLAGSIPACQSEKYMGINYSECS